MKRALIAATSLALALGTGYALAAGGHGPHWTYQGHEGPDHWGDLAADFGTCKLGKHQSPIDIKTSEAKKGDLKPIEFHYQKMSNPEVLNNGHTIQVNYAPGSHAVIGGKKYNLLQFHLHAPSEEAIDGKRADMVAHLVHKSDDGKLAVVGVMMNKGAANGAMNVLTSAIPATEGKQMAQGEINAADLLPTDQAYWNFPGSLTTPPCSEGVNWNVMKNPVTISAEQHAAYTKVYPNTARPLQPVNDRAIVSSN